MTTVTSAYRQSQDSIQYLTASYVLDLVKPNLNPEPPRKPCPSALQVDLSRYTLPAYMRIVTYKTAFYSFYLPVACGLLIGGAGSPEALRLARGICVEMGQYFQVRRGVRSCSQLY